MQSIFKDKRRDLVSISSNPSGTGRFFPPVASRTACVGPATRCRTLLTGEKNRSRHGINRIECRPYP